MQPNMKTVTAPSPVPTLVDTAFRALAYLQSVSMGGVLMTPHGEQILQARALVPAEIALRNVAAETIRHYISGEVDLDGDQMRSDATLGSERATHLFDESNITRLDDTPGDDGIPF